MPIAGNQDLWISGTRVYFQRDPVYIGGSLINQPIMDWGTLKPAPGSAQVTIQTLMDGDGGILRPIAVVQTQEDENYEFESHNFNTDMLAIMFNANPPSDFVQTADPITADHYVIPGRLVKLHDSGGIPVYGVASITSVTSSSTALVLGVDYEIVSLERGMIRILPSGSVVTTAGTISIIFVPRAITSTTGKKRLVLPHTGSCVQTGTALIVWGRCGNKQQTVRECRVAITPSTNNVPEGQFASNKIKLTVLTDPTLTIPAGRLLYWLGDMPALS